MKMRQTCLVLLLGVAMLQGEQANRVSALRLREDTNSPPQAYFIDQEGQLQTVEDQEKRKAQA